MSTPAYPPHPAAYVDPAVRRERLLLLCALDRARLRLIMRPTPEKPATAAHWADQARSALPWLAPLAPMLLGSWARPLSVGLGLYRAFRQR